MFEAARIRAGHPLFIDPVAGAWEYGAPPARYYVTYPPIWAAVVALVPSGVAQIAARLACSAAWFGALLYLVVTARATCRWRAALAALLVAGSWVLVNFASVGRPDAIACALAAWALVRIVRNGSADVLAAASLALVPWIKPTVVGLPLGAILGDAVARRRLGPVAVFGLAGAIVGGGLSVVSRGALFDHVVRSNAQAMTLTAWLDHVPPRLPFFGPLLAYAAYCAVRARREPGMVPAAAALGGATAWTLISLAKTGSASNYWMEPCVAAVVTIGNAPLERRGASGRLAWALGVLGAVAYPCVGSIRSALEHAWGDREDARVVGQLAGRCSGLVAADEVGIELAINGRVLAPAYQMAHLVRDGKFPPEVWARDLTAPNVACFVRHSGDLRVAPEIERAVADHYAPASDERGYTLFLRRSP